MHLEVSSDGAPADVDELCHVIVGVKGPNAALQVEVLVELNSLGLPDVGVELVWAVISRPQRDAVIGYIVQETRLCEQVVEVQIRTARGIHKMSVCVYGSVL